MSDKTYPSRWEIIISSDGNMTLNEHEGATGEEDGRGAYHVVRTYGRVPLVKVENELRKMLGQRVFVPPIKKGRVVVVSQHFRNTVVVVEEPPGLKKLIESVDSSSSSRVRLLSFPWMYFVIGFKDGVYRASTMRVFYRSQQVESLDSQLLRSNLTNSAGSGLCMKPPPDSQNPKKSLTRKIEALLYSFWNTEFTRDANTDWEEAKRIPTHPQSFEAWEKLSEKSPNWALNFPWAEAGLTINQAVSEHQDMGGYNAY